MKGRNIEPSDNWATPPKFMGELNNEFGFDFDPCPLNYGDITPENDGLLIEWGKMNYVNPPYSLNLKQAFVNRCVDYKNNGSKSVLLLPVSTSTKLFHDIIKPNAQDIRFLKGRIQFIGIDRKGNYINWHLWDRVAPEGVRHIKSTGMFDSMVVVM